MGTAALRWGAQLRPESVLNFARNRCSTSPGIRNAHNGQEPPKKTAVIVMVQRGGKAKARPVSNVDKKTITKLLHQYARRVATLMTDDAGIYNGIHDRHRSVNHSANEYVRGCAHTQTVECFNSLLKRGIFGTFHHVSFKYLQMYLDEFTFRWDHRFIGDGKRTEIALKKSEGKRLKIHSN